MGTVDVRTKHTLMGEWVVPQDYREGPFPRDLSQEVAAYRRDKYRPKGARQRMGGTGKPRHSRARPMRESNRNQPHLPSQAGSDRSAEPWRQYSLWKCALEQCDHPCTNTFLALEKHYMRWHQPQSFENVRPFGGYHCPLQPCSAHNPEPAMVRGHNKRHHCRELEWGRAVTELPYVVIDSPEMVNPGHLPRFPHKPQSGSPFRD